MKEAMSSLFWRIYKPIDSVERSFLELQNIATMINQVVFFVLCDSILVPGQKVTCLYTLMFYNVFAYCVSYIKELIEKENWSPYVHMTDHSNIKHLAMSATKIVLEWTKAVTFIITVVFMLLVFGLEQGLENYKPNITYTVVTMIYYIITEKVFVDILTKLVIYLQIPLFDNLEIYWLPFIFQALTAIFSFIFVIPVALYSHYRSAVSGLYVNVYLRLKDTKSKSYKSLNHELSILSKFRTASEAEILAFDDVCAVCLNNIKRGRITPCKHIFHSDCLRNCLKTSNHCPTCKRELKFE